MTRSTWLAVNVLLAVPLLAGGCSFNFGNPAEGLRPGEVQGRLVAERAGEAGAFDPLAGAVVGLRNSGFTELSRPSGYFTVLDLPQGQHVLLFRKGLNRIISREVEIGLGSDGQPEGVWLGDVPASYAVNVQGTVQGDTLQVINRCLAIDAATGLKATSTSDAAPGGSCVYEFPALGLGEHELRFVAWTNLSEVLVGGPLRFTLTEADEQTTKVLEPTVVRAPVGMGQLSSRVRIIGSNPGIGLSQIIVQVADRSPTIIASLTPDSTGVVPFPSLTEGYYTVSLSSGGGAAIVPPPDIDAVVLADQETDLGNIYVVGQTSAAQSQLDCRSDADCESGIPCANGLCSGWPMPAVAPPGLAACNPRDYCDTACVSGFGCALLDPPNPGGYCAMCDESCTSDGLNILTAIGCP